MPNTTLNTEVLSSLLHDAALELSADFPSLAAAVSIAQSMICGAEDCSECNTTQLSLEF